ncbi:hypothetical protein SFR_0960 [Streptomyces sp. FR-008]|nr:hypothetical protein SFR_0960 [Streptomyces sp. FR-008]
MHHRERVRPPRGGRTHPAATGPPGTPREDDRS